MRILLPVRPDNDCSEPARMIDALFGRDDVSILRIFVYRPAELDLYAPEMLAAVPGIRRLDEVQLREAVSATKSHCRTLLDYGFHVESAIVSGFPVEEIIREAISWKADLILLHVTQEKLHECRIGHIVGRLIDSSPVPVLIYPKVPETFGQRVCVVGQNASAAKWTNGLANRPNRQIHAIPEEELPRALGGDGCDLLVVPAHHQFAPAIFGSTDRRLIRHADVPVVLIP
jgi:nucleotide-binding universal stress UspA family protein